MKLIATQSFRNNTKLPVDKNMDGCTDEHIEKGTVFEVGKGDFRDKNFDPSQRQNIATLIYSGKVAPATDEIVAAVKAEVEVDKKREAKAKPAAPAK